MEKLSIGNYTICKMEVQEYNSTFGADAHEQYGANLTHIVWAEKYDNDNMVGMSAELMLVYADGTFAYTSRGVAQDCNFSYAMEVIMWIEEL